MGTITANKIIEKARKQLSDEVTDDDGGYRWDNDDLIAYLNEGQRAIVGLRPEASMTTGPIAMVVGTKQTLPAGALSLIGIHRNMGVGGATAGRAVQRIDGEQLDLHDPDWHTTTAATVVKHFIYDPAVPKVYYVYPPQTATPEQVEASYSVPPTDVVNPGSVITIDDIYEPALVRYVLHMAFAQDSTVGDVTKSQAHLQTFIALLTGQIQQDERVKA